MHSKKLDHIAIAVASIEQGLSFYANQLGLVVDGIETVEEQGVRVAKLKIGDTHIELLEPLDANTPVGRFLQGRGPGLHHLCFAVGDIEATLGSLKASGVQLIDQTPKLGASGAKIAFIHPRSSNGVLIELSEADAKDKTDAV